ncbi:unnamed protein product, partial [Rotaria sordida]
LNLRYHSLVNNTTFHIKINISSISKNIFESYCKHILIPYQNRIYSMMMENLFIFYLSLLLHTLSQYFLLEILILKNIESNHIISLLSHLSLLPNFSSLIIMSIDHVHNVNKQSLGHLILSNLTHLSFQNENISFNQIKLFIRNLSHQLQVFRFSTEFDITYLNANQWQELILSHMPYLRIFDIEL